MDEVLSLSEDELDAVFEKTGLRRDVAPLEVRQRGETIDERKQLVEKAWERLLKRGVAETDRNGNPRVAADWEGALTAWTAPDALIAVRASQDSEPEHVLYRCTITGQTGVLGNQLDGRFELAAVRGDAVPAEAVALLPPMPAVDLPRTPIVAGTPKQADGDDSDNEQTMASGNRSDEAALKPFGRLDVIRVGGFELSMRDDRGVMTRAGTVQFVDTEQGRYLVFTTPMPDGRRRLEFVPDDGSGLRRWLREEIARGV